MIFTCLDSSKKPIVFTSLVSIKYLLFDHKLLGHDYILIMGTFLELDQLKGSYFLFICNTKIFYRGFRTLI